MNVIRWITPIYIMVFLIIPINLQAQERHALLQKQVQITNTSLSLDVLSEVISKQTGLYLSFNSNKVVGKILLQKRVYAAEELLELIKSSTGSGYKIYEDHVIFHGNSKSINQSSSVFKKTDAGNTSKKLNSNSAANTSITKPNNTTNKTNVANTSKKLNSNSAANTSIAKPNNTIQKTYLGNTNQIAAPLKQIILEKIKVPQLPKTPSLLQKPGFTTQRPAFTPFAPKASWYAEGGFALDDNFYIQPTLTAGHPFLHAIFSWSGNIRVSGFRYGLGTSLPMKNNWRIGLQVTTGKLKRNFELDTLSRGITVKSDLHRLSLLAEKHLNNRLVLKAGPIFNLMKSSYSRDGNPITIATSGYRGTNGDREFYTIRPLYTLSNTYKPTEPSNTKTWIGFQASLFYRFNF